MFISKIRDVYWGKLHVSFYLNDKFHRWGLFYRDPKKYISFWYTRLGNKTSTQRLKDFFYYGVYANLVYWRICLITIPYNKVKSWF